MKKDAHNTLVNYKSLFWTPDYIEVSAWLEHIPFAFWLIEVFKPKTIVELGVHNGSSFFAFCQAIATLNLDSVSFGVDTWKGDEHAGMYTEEVFEKVAAYNTDKFSRFSTLIRSTFDEATNYFSNGTINLLHIDGLHTYEAVKHDFDTWRPKLSTDAIVLFHDINVRERNFGVFKLWEELKLQYRTFQFDFGHGLGVLAMGEIASDDLNKLFNGEDYPTYSFLRNLFSERGSVLKVKLDSSLSIADEKNKTESQQAIVSQLTDQVNTLNQQVHELTELNIEQEAQNKQLTEQYDSFAFEQNLLLQKQTEDIIKYKHKVDALNKEIKSQQQIIRWFKATYEERGILRILFGKVKKGLKEIFSNTENQNFNHPLKFLNVNYDPNPIVLLDYSSYRNKQKRFHLNPANDIQYSPETSEYWSEGSDPFFIIHLENKGIRAGWYWLSIEINEIKEKLFLPKLYYNIGRGFNEQDIWNLPSINDAKIECLIHFPGKVTELRFDPTIGRATFTIKQFHLKRASKTQALRIAISRYKKNISPDSSYLSFFGKEAAGFLKTGKLELRNKIRDFIYTKEQTSGAEAYKKWYSLYDTLGKSDIETISYNSKLLSYKPVFSVVMPVYNAPITYLIKAIESVREQAYPYWELCIADDKSPNQDVIKVLKEYEAKDNRIKIIYRETNGHISHATNSALELASGDYIVLLDQDDELRPHSLYMAAKALNENRDIELIYSDEDKIDEKGNRFDPYFKTDWNKDLFYGQNMISHLGVYKLSLIKKIGGFRPGYEGSQDYDLALRCIEHLQPDQIHHIPHILYHWRAISGSTAVTTSNKNYALDAGLKALNDHLKRTNQQATAIPNVNSSYRVQWDLPEQTPMVSIIIPTKDNAEVLATCVTSILGKNSYKNYEILIIDNNSQEATTFEYFDKIVAEHAQVKVLPYKQPFNFSAIVNYGVQHSKGEVIVLMNNDTEVINADWLREMVSHSLRSDIGAVGVKLFFPTGQIQHAGVFLYEEHPGNHIYQKKHKNDPGYFNKLNLIQNYSAVTAACLAVRKELYLQVGGFDETHLQVAYNDVDFCLKLQELGYRNLFTPFAQLFHYESLSRGSDFNEANYQRFKKEQSFMLNKWKSIVAKDPYFNPNLDIDTTTTKFSFPPKITYDWRS